jgi:hypothetical protein
MGTIMRGQAGWRSASPSFIRECVTAAAGHRLPAEGPVRSALRIRADERPELRAVPKPEPDVEPKAENVDENFLIGCPRRIW